MRAPGPVVLLLLTGALALSVGLRTEAPPRPPPRPVEPAPAPPEAGAPTPAAGPDLAGEVCDVRGRLVPGAEVRVERPEGTTVAAVVADGQGRFVLRVGVPPPLVVRLSAGGEGVIVGDLPCLDVLLVDPRAGPAGAGDLLVHCATAAGAEDAAVGVRATDALGDEIAGAGGLLSDGPFVLRDVPFGVLDVVVSGADRAGVRRGFAFSDRSREVTVPVGAAAALRGATSRPVRALLLPDPPAPPPLSRPLREADGLQGIVREAIATGEEDTAFAFEGLPAGAYRLRLAGEGVEVREIAVALAEGEVRDLGRLDLEAASAVLVVAVDEGGPGRAHAYLVEAWSPLGIRLEREVPSEGEGTAVFPALPAGEWFFRTGRVLEGPHHTQAAGWHRRVLVHRGETVRVTADCRW